MPPAATVWNSAFGFLGVIVDLDRQRRVAVDGPLREPEDRAGGADHQQRGRLADRPREAEDRAGQDPRQGRRAGRGRGPSASASPPAPAPPGGASSARSAAPPGWRSRSPAGSAGSSVRPPAQSVGPSASRLIAERPHEQRQAEDAVDDRRHAREVGDVRLDDPPEPARRGVLLEEDRRADPDRDREDAPPGRAARGCPTIPIRNPASAGSLDRGFVTSAARNANSSRMLPARSYQGWRGGRRSTAVTTEPSRTESTTTPVSVARKQAIPKSGPAIRRSRRCGS